MKLNFVLLSLFVIFLSFSCHHSEDRKFYVYREGKIISLESRVKEYTFTIHICKVITTDSSTIFVPEHYYKDDKLNIESNMTFSIWGESEKHFCYGLYSDSSWIVNKFNNLVWIN